MSERWIFTFGFGHVDPRTGLSLAKRYVAIPGDVNTSRAVMTEHFGTKWSMQYPSEEAAGVERYGLQELALEGGCPCCGSLSLEDISGDYPTGVVAPDGYREVVYEQILQCTKCGARTSDDELERLSKDDNERTTTDDGEPRYRRVKCSMCGALTTFDPVYEDLCYRCCRADNE